MSCRVLGSALRILGMNASTKLLIVALATSVWATWSFGTTIVVPDDYPTISQAVLVAQPGDTVLVRPGLYREEVNLRAGILLTSTDGWESTKIRAPSEFANAVHLLPPEEPGSQYAETTVSGFRIQQNNDYGMSPLFSENPHGVIEDCMIFSVGPADNGAPTIYLKFGGVVRRCWAENSAESSMFQSTEPGAEMLVEDCILYPLVYPSGLNGFGSGSVTVFKNNTFITPWILTYIWWPDANTDFTMLFVNNIFYHEPWIYCPTDEPMPDSLDFRYNCFWPYGLSPDCPTGPGNFVDDPLFCDEEEWDYRLEPESPCIGAGENGEDVGARLGICYPTSADEPELVSGPSLLVSPTVVGGRGCVIRLSLGSDSIEQPTVEILNVLGRKCAILRLGSAGPGTYSMRWDGTDDHGRRLPSGIYWIRARGILRTPTAKVLVLR